MTKVVVAFDTETALFRPGVMAPEMACLTFQADGGPPHIFHVDQAREHIERWLRDPEILLVGHNVQYDMAVICAQWPDLLPLVFEAYRADRVTDTMFRQKLLDIAAGCYRGRMGDDNKWRKYGYSLDDCIYRVRGSRLDKDTWRLRYGEFISVPLDQWPEGARQYPLEDARATLDVYQAQEVHAHPFLADQFRQARYYWALQLSSIWGLRTSRSGVATFEQATTEAFEEVRQECISNGLVRQDGTRNIKAAMEAMVAACEAEGLEVRLTDGGKPTLEKDACDAIDDPVIKSYSEFLTLAKILSNDVPMLLAGTTFPVHPHYDLADTGRTTCTGPNIQALRRKKGIREAFVPRPGKVFAQADFEGLELHTLAQACKELVGFSELGDVLNKGVDAHSELAASILGTTYDDIRAKIKDKNSKEYDVRQAAKVANFGFPVGLGAKSLVFYARKTYGVSITEPQAKILKQQWLARWPEMREYFAFVGELCDNPSGLGTVHQLFVGRQRGGSRYTAACSSFSQGLGGDAAKEAVWRVTEAMYTKPDSPLYGDHIVAFVHDEIIAEVDDDDTAHEAAIELSKLMREGANMYIKDYPVEAPPVLMRMWSKEAGAVYDANKRLVPWPLST